MLEAGQTAPDFSLPSVVGGDVTLSHLQGKPVVLYFYPQDDTPGCTKQACAFRDAQPRIKQTGAVVLGISPDSVASHARFRTKYKLNFLLLSDADWSVAKSYGAYAETLLDGKTVRRMIRSTFVIDAAGVVRKVFPKVDVDGHAEQVLEALRAL